MSTAPVFHISTSKSLYLRRLGVANRRSISFGGFGIPTWTSSALRLPPSFSELFFRISNGSSKRSTGSISTGVKSISPVMQWQDCTVKMEVDVPPSVAYSCYSDREAIPRWMPFISSVKDREISIYLCFPVGRKSDIPTQGVWYLLRMFSLAMEVQNITTRALPLSERLFREGAILTLECYTNKCLNLEDKPELSRWSLKYNALGRDIEFSWLARNMQPIPNQKIHWRSMEGLPNRGAVRFYPKGPSSCIIELTVSYEVPQLLAPVASALQPLLESLLRRGLESFAAFAKSYSSDSTIG